MTFFTLGNHHDFAITEVGEGAPSPDPRATGLAHVAFKIGDSHEHFDSMRSHLDSGGIDISTQPNAPSRQACTYTTPTETKWSSTSTSPTTETLTSPQNGELNAPRPAGRSAQSPFPTSANVCSLSSGNMEPWEIEQLRRSIVMLSPGQTTALRREEALAVLDELQGIQRESRRYRELVEKIRGLMDEAG